MKRFAVILALVPVLVGAAGEPVAHWSFDGEADHPATKLLRITPRPGVIGMAAGFGSDGKGRIEVNLDPLQELGIEAVLNASFTLELWILDTAAAPDNRRNYSLFYKADRHAFTRNSTWLYRARGDGNYHFRIRNSQDDGLMLTIPNPAGARSAGDGAWHHLAVTVEHSDSGRTGIAYLDGKEVARTTAKESGRLFSNDGKVLFGSNHHGDSSWHGALDEAAIYDEALPASTIARHHAAGRRALAPPPPPEPKISREEHFELHVRPLLSDRCANCHSGKPDAKNGLYVMSRKALIRGGEYGPTIIPGEIEESLLILAVKRIHKELRMPPDEDDRLSPREIAHLQRWIQDGAYWPEEKDGPMLAQAKTNKSIKSDHWAFQARRQPTVPKVTSPAWSQTEIDRFLSQAHEQANVKPVGLANRRTLIRRATFDLIGLPPTMKEVDAFLADPADDALAFANLVDRLLASRHYGERWGRHWLDVARYADTQGDVGDYPIPSAYKYRNWVIKALNADMPYDEFLRRQIAGDLLAEAEPNEQAAHDSIVATGFIALSRRFGNTKSEDMHLTIEDTLDTLGRGVLGLTLRCARCHDHKFDPVLNTDYYGLYGVFEGTRYPWMGASDAKSPSDLSPGKVGLEPRQKTDEYFRLITRYEYQMNNHFRPWLKPTLAAYRNVTRQLEQGGDTKQLKTEQEQLLKFRGGKFRELMVHGLDWIKQEKSRLGNNPVYDFVFAVSDRKAVDAHVHLRGNPKVPGELAPRRAPLFLGGESFANESASGRLELAEWLTNNDHPLTPRVIVNRVWAWHFGRGLVPTVDNFGAQGQAPSHPELLDWLANRFVSDGWSLKQLHRRVMNTRAYRLASDTTSSNLAKDPENRWLWHFQRRRLEAEAIRDAMLFVANRLDLEPGDAHPFRPWHARRYSLNGPFNENFDHVKRSVYLMTQRLFKHPFLGLFDGPDTNSSTPTRKSSSNPGQALYLMNAEPIRIISLVFADRALEQPASGEQRIQWIWHRAYSRPASADELQLASAHLARFARTAKNHGHLQREAWASLCRAVLTSNEFFYLN
ncbi:MAG: DUF1553 domain-containing protein [Limisphaerales bacterium]